RVCALTGSCMAGADEEIASLVREKEIPMVGAFTLEPQVNAPLNQYVFYINTGISDQGRALAIFAADKIRTNNPGASILFSQGKALRDAAAAIKKQCEESGWRGIEQFEAPASPDAMLSLVPLLRRKRNGGVFLGAG